MTIFYTQILSKKDLQIYCCAFSLHGEIIQQNNKILQDLRNVILNISNKSFQKTYAYKEEEYTFYIKIGEFIISIITDHETNEELAEQYLRIVESKLDSIDENQLKKESDRFNMHHDYIEADIELTKTRDVCVESLNKIVQRGEVIDKLGNLADKLREASHGLSKSSRNMYYNDLMNQYLIYIVIVLILFIIFYCFFYWK